MFLRDVPISQLGFKYVDRRGSFLKSSDGSTSGSNTYRNARPPYLCNDIFLTRQDSLLRAAIISIAYASTLIGRYRNYRVRVVLFSSDL